MKKTPLYSVLVPVYNSEKTLSELNERILAVMSGLKSFFEIIYIDDCSQDGSWCVLENLASQFSDLGIIRLSKNFGQDSALLAGLHSAKGEICIFLDDDLQHAPEDIPVLLTYMEKKSLDTVFGRFPKMYQSGFKNFGSVLNDKMTNIMLRKKKDVYLSSFKAVRRAVIEEILKYEGPYPYINGLIVRTTDNYDQVEVSHHKRKAGKTNYTFGKLFSLWSISLTNFSIIPLRIAIYSGITISITSFALIIRYIVEVSILNHAAWPGWLTLISVILFLGGLHLLFLGLLGEYIGRIFLNINKSPQFIVRDKKGF